MQSKGNAANAAQSRFYDEIARIGCILGYGHAEVHHVMGASFKHGGEKIGNWYVLAINDQPHRNGADNLDNNPDYYFNPLREEWGQPDLTDIQVQCVLFFIQLKKYERYYDKPHPVPSAVVESIRSLRTRGQSPFDLAVQGADPEYLAEAALQKEAADQK